MSELDTWPKAHLVLWCAYYSLKAEKEEERQLLQQLHSQMRR